MKRAEQEKYKNKLLKERKRILDVIETLKRNEVINSNEEMASELSFYDNHTADLGEELSDKEKGLAIKANEYNIVGKIDSALASIDDGTYGTCKKCKQEIPKERLEVIPYATYCVTCQNKMTDLREARSEKTTDVVTNQAFGYVVRNGVYSPGIDGEDILQAVDSFNWLENVDEYYDDDTGYVDPIEAISNDQYKRQLPD